ncbi:MAG: DNA internalization-related competence protein ComEC/Rec2 [Ignavibacteriaceae bacterium]|nr:DNA internalization-related competence protein ComEC/Rec2 [Ignavibacteriaceae bacterium]
MKDYPAIKVAIIIVAGILSAQFIQFGLLPEIIFFSVCLFLILLKKKISDHSFYFLLMFIAGGLLVFSIGNYLSEKNKMYFDPFVTKIDKVKNTTAVGEITNIDLIRNNEIIFYLAVDSLYSDEFFIKDKLDLLCKVRLDRKAIYELYNELKPGNYLKVTGFYHKGKQQRNPGEFDYNAYLKSKAIIGVLNISDRASVRIINSETNTYKNLIHQIRKSIDGQIKKYHSPETAGLLRGLLLADRGEINYQTKTQFINAGVVHVLAVSGLHVGYIIMIFIFLFGRFNLFTRSILTLTGLLFFMFITGVPPSVFRATVMSIVLIIALLTNRSTNLINSISIAALIILIINPNEIYNPGFQLSFAAVLAIDLLLPYFNYLIDKWNIQNNFFRYVILFGAVSLSAQIGTLPFTFLYFNKFSVIALFTNLFVIPGIGIIVATAMVTLFFSALIPFVAIYFGTTNDLFAQALLKLIKFSGDLSFSYISITNYSLLDLIIFYLMLAIFLFYIPRLSSLKTKIVFLILILANTFLYSSIDNKDLLPENYLSVFMIDVGQGDSFLIKFPNGKTALVDAGNTTMFFDNGERVIIPLLNYLGIKKIDYGIVTHIDSDHYGGFVALILENMIGEVLKTEIDSSLSKDRRFEEFIRERGIPIHYFKEEKIEIGNTSLYFLYDEKIKNISGNSTNDRSGIFKLVYGETSFLFTGDVEKSIERFYANKYKFFLDSDVLKVGHHGSKTSSSEEFISYVSPELSLISAGFKNKFGHPSKEVIQRLETEGSDIYRSDLQKAVLLRSDGQEIKLIKW